MCKISNFSGFKQINYSERSERESEVLMRERFAAHGYEGVAVGECHGVRRGRVAFGAISDGCVCRDFAGIYVGEVGEDGAVDECGIGTCFEYYVCRSNGAVAYQADGRWPKKVCHSEEQPFFFCDYFIFEAVVMQAFA